MRPLQSVLATCLAVVAWAGPAVATGFDLPPGTWWEDRRIADHLGLTAEQQAAIRDHVYHHARRMVDLNAAVKKTELDLRQAVGDPDFDPDTVRAAFVAFQTARQRLEAERFEMLLGVRQQLTADQWERLQEARRRLEQIRRNRSPGLRGDRPPRDPGGSRPERPGPR